MRKTIFKIIPFTGNLKVLENLVNDAVTATTSEGQDVMEVLVTDIKTMSEEVRESVRSKEECFASLVMVCE